MPIKKIEAGRVITQTIDTFIGIEGTIFYDEQTGELRLSDGVTPGGVPLAGGSSSGTVSITVIPNSGLTFAHGQLGTTYNSLVNDNVQSVAVGGAASTSASTWKSKNIVEVLDTILFPDVLPTYTIPTLTISGPQSGTKEIGSTVAQVLSLIGTEGDASTFTALAVSRNSTQLSSAVNPLIYGFSDIAAQFGYADPNNPNYSYVLGYTDNFVVVSGNTSWSGTGTYLAGGPKKNNKGVTDVREAQLRNTSAPQAASSISSNSITVTGIYPYFWGKSNTLPTAASIAAAILAGSTNKVLTDASGTVSVTFAAAGQYVWMAHSASYTSKTKWFNTQLNQGSIGAGNFILSPVTQSVGSPDGLWTGVSYKVYISSGATNTEGVIEFRNT